MEIELKVFRKRMRWGEGVSCVFTLQEEKQGWRIVMVQGGKGGKEIKIE